LLLAGAAVWQWQAALAAQRLAQEQRDRAERTLAAATETIIRSSDMAQGCAIGGHAGRSDAQDLDRARGHSGNSSDLAGCATSCAVKRWAY
jgi:hypothetical protein